LRTFFASNCSQQATAKELRAHQKTIAYRLEKVDRIAFAAAAILARRNRAHVKRVRFFAGK